MGSKDAQTLCGLLGGLHDVLVKLKVPFLKGTWSGSGTKNK